MKNRVVVVQGVNASAENIYKAQIPTNSVGGTGRGKRRKQQPTQNAPATHREPGTHITSNNEVKSMIAASTQRCNLKATQSPSRQEAITATPAEARRGFSAP